MIRIMLVDDHRLVRAGLRRVLQEAADMEVMAEASSGEEALANLRALLKRYAAPEQAFLSKPRVLRVRIYDDYDQLARRQEWADAEGEE